MSKFINAAFPNPPNAGFVVSWSVFIAAPNAENAGLVVSTGALLNGLAVF